MCGTTPEPDRERKLIAENDEFSFGSMYFTQKRLTSLLCAYNPLSVPTDLTERGIFAQINEIRAEASRLMEQASALMEKAAKLEDLVGKLHPRPIQRDTSEGLIWSTGLLFHGNPRSFDSPHPRMESDPDNPGDSYTSSFNRRLT
jgi:hypothetical protein